jgi:hypothetical protein
VPADQAVQSVQSVVTARGPAWKLRTAGGDRWLDADGRELTPPDAEAVGRFARALYRGPARQLDVQQLAEVPARLGLVRELAAVRPVWRAAFDDALQTRLYIDSRGGELLAVRNEAWVWYDFFWRLHVMDYGGGEDFNNALLRVAAVAAAAMVLAGALLSVLAARRALRRRRAA